MRLRCMIPSLHITMGLAVFLIITPGAFSQAPPEGAKPAEAKPAAVSLSALQEQVQELSAALREMRAEVKEARNEATELKQELKSASDQLLAIQREMTAGANRATVQATPAPPPAQAPASEVQQLDGRVAKVEEEQQLLSSKVDDQYQTKVESGSKYRVRLSGMALFNAFTTRGATDNFDVPSVATEPYPSQPNGAFGATLRQSVLGLDVFGPEIAGAKTRADIRVDFFGGFPNSPDGVTSSLVRLRTAGFRLDWQDTSLVAGQYGPFFSPLSPTSLASVAYPALASSGNLWRWTPQIYVEHRIALSDGSSVSLQGGIMDPLTGEAPTDPFYRVPQAGESGGQPAYAARVAWGLSSDDGPVSLGAGGYYAHQNWGGRIVDAWAGTADGTFPLSHGFSLTGEFYRGRAIGGLGAAEGQSVVFTGGPLYGPLSDIEGLNSTGGWAQLKFMPVERLEFNGAWGEDYSPTPTSYYAQGYNGQRVGRNQGAFFNGIYHLRSNVMFSLEYRRLRTAETQPGLFQANQVSLSAATLF
jgi:hypothetical protein